MPPQTEQETFRKNMNELLLATNSVANSKPPSPNQLSNLFAAVLTSHRSPAHHYCIVKHRECQKISATNLDLNCFKPFCKWFSVLYSQGKVPNPNSPILMIFIYVVEHEKIRDTKRSPGVKMILRLTHYSYGKRRLHLMSKYQNHLPYGETWSVISRFKYTTNIPKTILLSVNYVLVSKSPPGWRDMVSKSVPAWRDIAYDTMHYKYTTNVLKKIFNYSRQCPGTKITFRMDKSCRWCPGVRVILRKTKIPRSPEKFPEKIKKMRLDQKQLFAIQ
ncbi:hypothetical protein TSAR_000787 [Trichomalopsis sarcophagae]|uniref:Uncharacterized protein n=1 Tax=Trichomalopsis sarcophagae TaxID=543379 RepID=A0A232FLR1_9HYME|nr:hypothetical protein TSAR_000787 [Trichomalopsis sarcophagae]